MVNEINNNYSQNYQEKEKNERNGLEKINAKENGTGGYQEQLS